MSLRTKVSVTLRSDLLRELDRIAGKQKRSALFEDALSTWLQNRRRSELDQAIDSYYRSLDAVEIRQDDDWAALGDATVRDSWSDSDR